MQKTPTQQALIQFIESIVITALIAGVASISNLLIGNGQINWQQAGITFGFAIVFSLAHSLSAYLKALPAASQGQPDYRGLGTVMDAFVTTLEQRLSAVVTHPAQPVVAQPQAVQVQPAPQPATITPGTIAVSTPAQIDWSSTNPAFKAVNLVPPTQQQ